MPVTRADELDARPADHAKELLALADRLEAWIEPVSCGYIVPAAGQAMSESVSALRLSARQQASVEDVRQWLNEQPYKSSTLAERLLAKYDIFEKVEG